MCFVQDAFPTTGPQPPAVVTPHPPPPLGSGMKETRPGQESNRLALPRAAVNIPESEITWWEPHHQFTSHKGHGPGEVRCDITVSISIVGFFPFFTRFNSLLSHLHKMVFQLSMSRTYLRLESWAPAPPHLPPLPPTTPCPRRLCNHKLASPPTGAWRRRHVTHRPGHTAPGC